MITFRANRADNVLKMLLNDDLKEIVPVTPQKYPRIFIIKLLHIPGIVEPTWVFFWELLDEY